MTENLWGHRFSGFLKRDISTMAGSHRESDNFWRLLNYISKYPAHRVFLNTFQYKKTLGTVFNSIESNPFCFWVTQSAKIHLDPLKADSFMVVSIVCIQTEQCFQKNLSVTYWTKRISNSPSMFSHYQGWLMS